MTGRKQNTDVIVSRAHKHDPDSCAAAVQLLLTQLPTRSKQGGPMTAPDVQKEHNASDRAIILK